MLQLWLQRLLEPPNLQLARPTAYLSNRIETRSERNAITVDSELIKQGLTTVGVLNHARSTAIIYAILQRRLRSNIFRSRPCHRYLPTRTRLGSHKSSTLILVGEPNGAVLRSIRCASRLRLSYCFRLGTLSNRSAHVTRCNRTRDGPPGLYPTSGRSRAWNLRTSSSTRNRSAAAHSLTANRILTRRTTALRICRYRECKQQN